jgi:hypothetical protein
VRVGDAGERRKALSHRELARVASKDAVNESRSESGGSGLADVLREKLVHRRIESRHLWPEKERAQRREQEIVEQQVRPNIEFEHQSNHSNQRDRHEIQLGVWRQPHEAARGDAFGGHAKTRGEAETIDKSQSTQCIITAHTSH